MGRTKQSKRTGKRNRGRRREDHRPWEEITKENEMFEKYYKAQNIIPESEWEEFMSAFRRDLPSTFRITGTRSESKRLLEFVKKNYLENISEIVIDGEKVEAPKMLSWYPDELAWQVTLSRKFIRKSSTMAKFHHFLVQETECGNISRQETVSMLPPLLLDVKPGQKVLDTCAAPGSKTSQIIEMLHADECSDLPDGLVIANELQNKRCYMLIHQSKRLRSPSCLITNHDAALYPTLFIKNNDGVKVPLKFDRILCDVPCSGDGTMRKNSLIWNKWTPQTGLSLHRIQMRILARAVEMLEVGGRTVYSTCSLNPVENEAVICQLLKHSGDSIELVDVSNELPDLKRSKGLLNWKLMLKTGQEVTSCEPGSEAYKGCFRPSHFPLPEEDLKAMNIDRCIRVYPHQQDTGGFFIAVLVKKKLAPWENENRMNDNPRWLPWQTQPDGQIAKVKDENEEFSVKTEHVGESEEALDATQGEWIGATEDTSQDMTEDVKDKGILQAALMPVKRELNDNDNKETTDDMTEDVEDNGILQAALMPVKRELDDNDNKETTNDKKMDPPKKKPKMDQGFKEDPFVLLPSDDPVWVSIKEFYGVDSSFPSDQLLVRTITGKKRSIYIVSKPVKQVLECVDDSVKIINCGVKAFGRCDSSEEGCEFRIMQEGIDSIFPYITKRKVFITQEDVFIFLEHDKPFTNKFSQTTRDQLKDIPGLGCVLFIYEPKGTYSSTSDSIDCSLHFCGWKAKTSIRVLASKMDKTHYMVLCGIVPGEKVKNEATDDSNKQHTEVEADSYVNESNSITILATKNEPIDDIGFV